MAAAPHELVTHGAESGAHAAAEGHSSFPPFDPATFSSQLVWFALTFGALYFILSRFVLPQVQAVLDKRASTLKSDLDKAAAESAAAEGARTEMERSAEAARARARGLIEDQRAKAAAELAAEQAKVDESLAADIRAAEARIGQARDAALAQVDALAGDLAKDIVARLAPGVRA